MRIAPAQPDSKAVFEAVNAYIGEITHYVSSDDLDLRRLLRKAEQLMNADSAEGNRALATLYQVTGDRDKALPYIAKAIQCAEHETPYLASRVAILCNLGYFSEAQKDFRRAANPEGGGFTRMWDRGYLCGAFETMKTFLAKARKMKLKIEDLDILTAERAANVLEGAGIKEATVGKMLDVAGNVLREQKLFYVGDGPRIHVFDNGPHDPFIEYSFNVDLPPVSAHELYGRFVDQLVRDVSPTPRVMSISFLPWRREHERSAA